MSTHLCQNCAADILAGAKFCHRCGDKVIEKSKPCPACHEQNPQVSVFCHHCGFHFEGKKQKNKTNHYIPMYPLTFDPETLTDQVKAMFFKQLRQRVGEEHDIKQYPHYVERFYHSKFAPIYNVRSKQIAEDALIQWERFGQNALPDIDNRIETAFDGLLDYFFIQFCPDLNSILLPQEILKHEHAKPGRTDLWGMIRDYLNFENEVELYYFDFITMPQAILGNACKSFLTAERKERVYFIGDLSLNGSCKEGFSMTNQAIYWRSQFNKPRKVLYEELKDVKLEKDWLSINGHFFTANPSMNLKMFKVLKKLRGWREPVFV